MLYFLVICLTFVVLIPVIFYGIFKYGPEKGNHNNSNITFSFYFSLIFSLGLSMLWPVSVPIFIIGLLSGLFYLAFKDSVLRMLKSLSSKIFAIDEKIDEIIEAFKDI